MTKTCNICQAEKSISEFYKQAKAKDGYQNRCKACANGARKVWVEDQKEDWSSAAQELLINRPDYLKTCSLCNIAKPLLDFYVNNASPDGRQVACALCSRQRNREYQLAHPEQMKANGKAYRAAHPDMDKIYYWANPKARNAAVARWVEKNPGYAAQWARNNPDKMRATRHKRRDKLSLSLENFTAKEWRDMCEFYNYQCLRCLLFQGDLDSKGRVVKMTADHVVPVEHFGSNGIHNIQPLCGPCNSSKGTKHDDYRTAINYVTPLTQPHAI